MASYPQVIRDYLQSKLLQAVAKRTYSGEPRTHDAFGDGRS